MSDNSILEQVLRLEKEKTNCGLVPGCPAVLRFLRELQTDGRMTKEWAADPERWFISALTWPDGVPEFLVFAEFLVGPDGFTDGIKKNLTELRLRGLIEHTIIGSVPLGFSYKRGDGWEVELRKDSQERYAARVSSPDGSFVQSLGLSVQPWQDVEGFSLTRAGMEAAGEQDGGDMSRTLPPRRHSPDFTSVHWDGADYTFTPLQARCIHELWNAMENGTPVMRGATILTEVETDTKRLVDVFKGHPAWGKMILPLPEPKGSVRLAP